VNKAVKAITIIDPRIAGLAPASDGREAGYSVSSIVLRRGEPSIKVVTMSVTKKENARKSDIQSSTKNIMLLALLSPPFTRPVILDD
jgi:hypothetical protein